MDIRIHSDDIIGKHGDDIIVHLSMGLTPGEDLLGDLAVQPSMALKGCPAPSSSHMVEAAVGRWPMTCPFVSSGPGPRWSFGHWVA